MLVDCSVHIYNRDVLQRILFYIKKKKKIARTATAVARVMPVNNQINTLGRGIGVVCG